MSFSSTEKGVIDAWYRYMGSSQTYLASAWMLRDMGFSVRCIQGPEEFTIGQNYGGGIIFCIDSTGQHGLIAATSNRGTASWGCIGTPIDGTSTKIRTVQANTTAILKGYSEAGIAARICNNLVLNGYDDWFLPSQNELYQMYKQKSDIGDFASDNFWRSSEFETTDSLGKNFGNGMMLIFLKDNTANHIRAIRAF